MSKCLTPKNIVTIIFSPFIIAFGGIAAYFNGGKILTKYKGVFGKATAYFLSTCLLLIPMSFFSMIFIIATPVSAVEINNKFLPLGYMGSTRSPEGMKFLAFLIFLAIMAGAGSLGLIWFSKVNKRCPKHLQSGLMTSMLMVAGGIGIFIGLIIFSLIFNMMSRWVLSDSREVMIAYSSNGDAVRIWKENNSDNFWIETSSGSVIPARKTAVGFSSNDGQFSVNYF